MPKWFITVFLMLLPLLLLACGSGNDNGEAATQSDEAVTHRIIPKALEGSHDDKVWFAQVFISMAPKPALVNNGEFWGFRAYHEGALKGQGTMDIYVDADAISFEPKPGESVKIKGVLRYGEDERLTVQASSVERLPCNDTKDCR
jgi:hypothetical protein